jgi:hypothetical protein
LWSVVIPRMLWTDHMLRGAMAQAKAGRTRAALTAAWCCGCVR